MKLFDLCWDMFYEISKYLDDKSFVYLINTSKLSHYSDLSKVKLLTNLYYMEDIKHCLNRYKFQALVCDNSDQISLLPKSCNCLYFDNYFNEPIYYLPDHIIHLSLGNNYNSIIYKLPDNLISLEFGFSYNKPLPKLPNKLKYLTLNFNYQHPLSELPLSLKQIILEHNILLFFNDLPDSITTRFIL